MSASALPNHLQAKLDDFQRRLRRLQAIRGLSVVIICSAIAAGVLLAADAWLEFPPLIRSLGSAAWLVVTFAVVWRALVRPLRHSPSAAGLAAAVEGEFPRLSERLTSTVELAEHAQPFHGSPRFVRLLVHETDLKTRALDFRRAAPAHTSELLGVGALAALLGFVAPALLATDYFLGLGRRFLMPWDARPAIIPFDIAVTPGDGYAALGRPITFTGELVPRRGDVALPTSCTLVLTPAGGKPQRLRMSVADRPNAFRFRLEQLAGNVRYHLEAGADASAAFALQAVEPVDLAANSPTVTATPPEYARAMVENQTVSGLADFNILQYSQLLFDARFTRPAAGAALLWSPEPADGKGANPQRVPFELAADGLSGRVALPARSSGRLQLVLEAEHGVTTDLPVLLVVARPDHGPRFQNIAGFSDRPRDVAATDSLTVEMTILDDLGVAAAEFEYRCNDGPLQSEPIALTGQGTGVATGRHAFEFASRLKEGDRLQYRVRARDTRSVPDAGLGPNVAVHPPHDRWGELRIVSRADSARDQEITGQREDVEKRLKALIQRVAANERSAYGLRKDVENGATDPAEQRKKLDALAEEHAAAAKQLDELTADVAVMAGLRPLADGLQAVAEREFRAATEGLQRAGQTAEAARATALKQADQALMQARERLEALLEANRKLAEARQDQAKVQELADRESDLAERAVKAETDEDRAKLREEQQQLAEQLEQLGDNNPSVRAALEAARAERARQLAEQAKDLARKERDLDKAITEAERDGNIAKFADLARRQQELADRARQLADQTKDAAQAAKAKPLDAKDAARAADQLKRGDAETARRDQEQAADKLERLAKDLQTALELSRDPRESALQLSRVQDATRQRLRERPEDRAALQREQEAIRDAASRVPVAADNSRGKREQAEAVEKARQAADALKLNDPSSAGEKMQQARRAFDRLADALPTLDQRKKAARDEVARLRKQQDEVAAQSEKAARAPNARDGQAAAKEQADIAERLARLDAPNEDARRDAARQAASAALEDLLNRRLADQPATQQAARRALERLEQALAGQKSDDEVARDLARRQGELAATQPADEDGRRDLARRQEKLTQEVQALKPTDAPVRQGEAREAAVQAARAAREQPSDPATAAKMHDAAEKLEQLANQLAGRESNAGRAERLAQKQEQVAKGAAQRQRNDTEARRQTNQLADEAKQVRAGDRAGGDKQDALDALQQAQRHTPGTPQHAAAQQAAAQALRKLADKLNGRAGDDTAQAPASADPAELANRQRQLAERTEAAQKQPAANQQAELARVAAEQRQLQQDAARLPADTAPRAVQQARQAMQHAEQALAQKNPGQARQQQQQAAQALDQAARQAAEQGGNQPGNPAPGNQPSGLPTAQQVEQARALAQQQRQLQDDVRGAAGERPAPAPDAARRETEIANQTEGLRKSLEELAGQAESPDARQSGRQAADAAQQAGEAMRQAQQAQGREASDARHRAADALDRAGQQSQDASQASQPGQGKASPNGQPINNPSAEAGQSLQDAQGKMDQAGTQLGTGQRQDAQQSMKQAAQALRDAARQMGQSPGAQAPDDKSQPAPMGSPAEGAGVPQGAANASGLPKDLQPYVGKPWGELPGELRTRIMQEIKSQYGEDYARVIKLYFEQIAERKAGDRR